MNERENALAQTGKKMSIRFIEPGLVHYNDVGTVLVSKATLDKMAPSIVGRPVFNQVHKDVTGEDFSAGHADGIITAVRYNAEDGWYWADMLVWDAATRLNCESGYSVSCAYDVSKWSDRGGIHNNIAYDREVLDGDYTHLAIVNNPRYEGARIIYNSKGGSMKLAFWRKDKEKPEVRNASEVETADVTLEVDGKDVPLDKALELWNASEKAKADAAAAAAAKPRVNADDEIMIGEKKVLVSDLINAVREGLKNAPAEDDDDEKKRKAKEAKDAEERKNAEAKDDGDDDDAKKKAEEKKRENARHFEEMRNAAAGRPNNFKAPEISTPQDRVTEGSKRYGTQRA